MAQLKQKNVVAAEAADSTWTSLYRVGGAAPLIALASYLTQILAMIFGGGVSYHDRRLDLAISA